MTAQAEKKELPDFETAISELENIVNQMETGNLSLEASLDAFKRGAALLQHCQQSLTEAEQQVRILNESNKLTAFDSENEKK
jgi:exodeoxyribonuclease VII small subunit